MRQVAQAEFTSLAAHRERPLDRIKMPQTRALSHGVGAQARSGRAAGRAGGQDIVDLVDATLNVAQHRPVHQSDDINLPVDRHQIGPHQAQGEGTGGFGPRRSRPRPVPGARNGWPNANCEVSCAWPFSSRTSMTRFLARSQRSD